MTRSMTSVVLLSLLGACTTGPGDDYANVLPDDRLLINMPVDYGASARSDVGDRSEYQVLTADVGDRAMRFDSLLGGGPPVTVLSDRAQIAIGHTLKRAESDYLAEVLRGALSAEPVSGR